MSGANYIEDALLDHVTGKATYTGGGLYIGLCTAVADDETGSFTEVSGGSYARQSVPASSWGAASGGTTTTTADIQFPVATASYGTVTHILLASGTGAENSGGGNLVLIQELGTHKTVAEFDQFVINSGNLSVSLD